MFRKNADHPRFHIGGSVEQCGRDSFNQLAIGLEFSPQVPRRAPPTISQVTKRGNANLALHNFLPIPHRELERHQGGIIPNGLTSRQRHAPASFRWSIEADREVGPSAERPVAPYFNGPRPIRASWPL